MTALWYLLVLAPFVAIPILWWGYRRKMAERDSRSDARWQEVVIKPAANPEPASPIAAAQPAFAVYVCRKRLLDPAQTVLYYLLKNGLPEHEVMFGAGLASLLELPAGVSDNEREQRLRALAQHTVDFVVCNKAMQVVITIDLPLHDMTTVMPEEHFKAKAFSQAGIRYLRLSRKALPKREAVRGLVLGA